MSTSSRQNAYLAAGFAACLTFLFWPGLFGSEVPAFRDTYHFYYPQAVWLCERAAEGDYFPAWTSNEGLGSSVRGQASAALYYPLRILWATPGFTVAQRLSLYIVVHLLVAAAGMGLAAKQLGVKKQGAWLAAISFSLSCPIVFQHSNLIYLHSAAWLGFAVAAVLQLLDRRTAWLRSCLLFVFASSMMILGGDFHTAVNTHILASLILAIYAVKFSGKPISTSKQFAGWLVTALLLIAAVTAIQWIPTYRWSRHSDRISASQIEGAHQLPVSVANLNLIHSLPRTRHQIYDFSLSPWHAATLVWPTLGGHYQPGNGRIFSAIPAEGRMWLPSLYVGLIPCLLLLTSQRSVHRYLLLSALGFSFLASLGNYSPVWLAREICEAFNLNGIKSYLPSDQASSLYQLLTLLVPGYDSFRYPAKWTVWIAASISLLAGLALQKHEGIGLRDVLGPRLRWALLGGSIAIGVAALLLVSNSPYLSLPDINDAWLGTLNNQTAGWMLVASVVPSLLLCFLAYFVTTRRRSVWVWFTLIEMTFAASFWIHFCPAPEISRVLDFTEQSPPAFVWANASKANLLRDIGTGGTLNQTEYQYQWMLGKLATLADARNMNASMTIEPASVGALQNWLSDEDSLDENQPSLDSILGELGVTHRLARVGKSTPTRYAWQRVASPKPMCELLLLDGSPGATVSFGWTSSRQLVVEVPPESSPPNQLIVRQYNDGGWIVQAKLKNGEQTELDIDSTPSLFVSVSLPSDVLSITLRRKFLH